MVLAMAYLARCETFSCLVALLLQPLPLVDADEDAHRSNAVLDPLAGGLEQRVEILKAEPVPLHRSRKCPCCDQLSLTVVATPTTSRVRY
jgi:hypothetical protein